MPLVVIDLAGTRLTPDERALLADEPVAGICLFARNTPNRDRARALVAEARAAAGRPLLVAVDQEGGAVVRLRDGAVPPPAMALGAADDLALTEAVAAATARDLRGIGANVDFAPVADVALDPRNPVIGERAFASDPDRTGRHVAAFVRGLQGAGVAATLKHFPGHGDVDVDSHHALPRLDVDVARLRAVEWAPFRDGLAAGAAAVMTAHLVVPSLDPDHPATLAPATIAALRGELGFDGVVFSDALDMRAIADRWSAPDAAVLALAAGVDAPLVLGATRAHVAVLHALAAAQRDGRLDSTAVAVAEARVARLAVAFPAGADAPDAMAERAADAALMAAAARRGVTALGRLPRLDTGHRVVLVGRAPDTDPTAVEAHVDPAATLAAALARAGVPVARFELDAAPEALAAALTDAQALLVVSAQRRPWQGDDLAHARDAFAAAARAAVPAVHVALWNPALAASLPGPALLAYGFRGGPIDAAVHALLRGEAPGRCPMPLTPWSPEGAA